MGHRGKSKKKKRGGTGRRPVTDYKLLSEELVNFKEDCEFISANQIKINLRPYSQDPSSKVLDVPARLSISFFEGYPSKRPMLLIESEQGLSKSHADRLLSKLYGLADVDARAGHAMILNLVTAAQKFLSDLPREAVAGPFIHSYTDLFIGSEGSWQWRSSVEESSTSTSLQDQPNGGQLSRDKVNQIMKTVVAEDNKLNSMGTLDSLEDERSWISEDTQEESATPDESESEHDESESEHSRSASAASRDYNPISHNEAKDLVLAHLLRLACSSKGPLAVALTDVASELASLGIVSDRVAELVTDSSFDESYNAAFEQYTVTSRISSFWEIAPGTKGPDTSPASGSRYLNDFEEVERLGRGGYGYVVLCKNKLDGRQYAVKIVPVGDESQPLDDLILSEVLSEVTALSRLQHQHIVRYYQAWVEIGYAGRFGHSYSGSSSSSRSTDVTGQGKNAGKHLYIQMERCQRTLAKTFVESDTCDKKVAWHMFRQIVEGLAHIHAQGIIHRDLYPENIFFDSRNDIKIGDFGLAKFLKHDIDREMTELYASGTDVNGALYYRAPEIVNQLPKINEKVDIYSLGIIFFELWRPFKSEFDRCRAVLALKEAGAPPPEWAKEFPEQAALLKRMISLCPADRPSAAQLLKNDIPPRMESELLHDMLRALYNSSVYDNVVGAVFSDEMINTRNQANEYELKEISSMHHVNLESEIRDLVSKVSSTVFTRHSAKRSAINPMCLVRDSRESNRNAVKHLSHVGDMIEFCYELRLPFIKWAVSNQKTSFKRFEICDVYRKPIGHSPPSKYLQGDFDIIGGASTLREAEAIKAAMSVITRFIHPGSCYLHMNHADLLEAIWLWIGVEAEHRQKVAELMSLLGSTQRKAMWLEIKRQLKQELGMEEGVLNKLERAGLTFCGTADHALPTLRGVLYDCVNAIKALDILSQTLIYMRIWKIQENVFIDPLMPPTEGYHRELFFQIRLGKINKQGTLLAIGGRYDYLLHQMWQSKYQISNPPGGVGISLALETIIHHSCAADICRPYSLCRNDASEGVLVCSIGEGGLLDKRMELASELWEHGIKADFVPTVDPSPTEQYKYAREHGIKYLIKMSEASVKICDLERKIAKEVARESLVRVLSKSNGIV